MDRITEKDEQGNKIVLKKSFECFDGERKYWSTNTSLTGAVTIRGYAADKLAEYEDLEEQGLLPKLPCKAGTKIFILRKDIKKIIDGEVIRFHIGEFMSTAYVFITDDNRYTEITFDNFGKTVFLTQAEAEDVLKRIKKEE